MKIGLVIDDTLDTTDGVQQYVLLIGGWLSGKGHDVHYLCGESKRSDIKQIHSLAKNIRVKFNKNILSMPLPASIRNIKQLLVSEQFDVLHIQMPYSPFLGGRVINLAPKSTAIVGTFHVAPHSSAVTFGSKLLGIYEHKSLRRLDSVLSVSDVAQDFARQSQRLKSQVVPNAVDVSYFKPQKKTNRPNDIIFLGRLVERKGCRYLLKAVCRLKKNNNYSQIKVIIAGDGPLREELEDYTKKHQLSDNVTFEGYVTEAKKRDLLHSSKIAVFPSTGGESFGIVLLEAIASGCVVLAGNNPGYSSVLNNTPESLFLPINTKQVSEQIDSLLSSEHFYKKQLNIQEDILTQFDINTVGSAILKIYTDAIKEHNDRTRQ